MKVFILAALIAIVAAESYSSNSYKNAKPAYNKHDYAAIPYSFEWAVKDDYYYNDYSHQESGDGNGKATGSYRVLLPDGRIQTVTYTSDSYGYVADVKYDGEAKYPEYNPSYQTAHKPAYSASAKY